MPTPASTTPITAAAWDEVRRAFAHSPMLDTPLSSLSADLDCPPWPAKSADETPAAYIYLSHEEAVMALASRGMAPAQLTVLANILRDTMSFDTPFDDMMPATRSPFIEADNPLLRALPKLGLAEDFPLALSGLSAATLELCRLEGVTTLGAFVRFAAGLSQNIVVGGDFKDLLNSLSHTDEATLSRLLPYRRLQKGFHLFAALEMAVQPIPVADLTRLATQPREASVPLLGRIDETLAYFKADVEKIRAAQTPGDNLGERLREVTDTTRRAALAALLKDKLAPHPSAANAAPTPAPRRSWWSRLFSR